MTTTNLIVYAGSFNVYKLKNVVHIENFSVSIQDMDEITTICPQHITIPSNNIISCSTNWKLFKIDAELDFTIPGILSNILTPIADIGVSVLVLSAFSTDYILIPNEKSEQTFEHLKILGYKITFNLEHDE